MLGTSSAVTNSLALWELYEKFPQMQKEYKDVKLLWLYANPTFQLHFRKDLVKKLEDLRGRIISTESAMGLKILKRLGAVPENIPMVDVYMALQKGVVDGCMLPYAPLKSQRIAQDPPIRLPIRRGPDLDPWKGGHPRGNTLGDGWSVHVLRSALSKALPTDGRPWSQVLPGDGCLALLTIGNLDLIQRG